MIILFDGCDNTGKTHIATELAKRNDMTYFKYQGVKDNNIRAEERINIHEKEELYSIELFKVLRHNLVVDRHYPGDYAYGQLYRKHPVYRIMKVDEEFSKINRHLVIICHKPKLTVKTEDFIPPTDYKAIHDLYLKFFEVTKTNCILLDTTTEDLVRQIGIIEMCINDVFTGEFKNRRWS